jgi:hypothetical protein
MIFGVIGLLAGCKEPQVQTHPLAHPFPTQATLPGSVFQVQKALQVLWRDHAGQIFTDPVLPTPSYELFWKGHKHPAGITIFKSLVNENDVYVSCAGKPIRTTPVYTDEHGNALALLEDFQVHLIPQGSNETLVKVIGIEPTVLWEDRYWWGGKKGRTRIFKVEPTTQEENLILEKLQALLDEDA